MCGSIRSVGGPGLYVAHGVFTKVQMQAQVPFVSDVQKEDETTETQMTLMKYLEDEVPVGDN